MSRYMEPPMPWRTRLRSMPQAVALLSWSSVFAIFGALLFYVQAGATPQSAAYTSTPEFKVWATLTIAMITALPTIWTVGIRLLIRLGADPWRLLSQSWLGPVLVLVVLAITVAAFVAGRLARGNGSPFYGGQFRVAVIYVLAIAATAPAFVAMWECYRQTGHLVPASDGITKQLELRDCLLSALTTLGTLVSLGVFVVGAERLATLTDPKLSTTFPAAYVLIWGFSFSALLAVNFLPAFHRLNRIAKATVDALLPVEVPGTAGWQARLQERKDLADLLKLTGSTRDVLMSAILVAGPLISSAFALFLPGASG
jgi:hypothetical protein